MKILQVINAKNPGGLEQHVRDLSRSLIAKGHTVFVRCEQGIISDWYKSDGAQVTTDTIKFDIDPFYIYRLVSFIKQNKIDIVHAHEPKAGLNTMLVKLFLPKLKIITHVHTPMSEWQIINPLKKFVVKIENFIYSVMVNLFSSCEIALTESRKKVKIKEGISPQKIAVIHNGLDFSAFSISPAIKSGYRNEIRARYGIPQSALVLGDVGRLTIEKGHRYLVESFSKISKLYTDKELYLLLAGGGQLVEEIKNLASRLGITEKVKITGIFESSDVAKYYAAMDLFVFPTLAEGFGIVLIEALASSLPVVSSDLPVLQEVAADTAIYFKTGDIDDMVNKIDDSLKNGLAPNNKGFDLVTTSYSLENFVTRYIELYKKII